MSLIIFSCSPRPKNISNTAAIAEAFKAGFVSLNGDDINIYHIYERNKWDYFKKAFDESDEIIFAIPLFIECIPGLLMEFLETLNPKKTGANKPKIGFILQGGFEEACQLRTCEAYLEKLPSYFNCAYSGTLIKGGMFGLSIVSEKTRTEMLKPFCEMGKIYYKEKLFEKSVVNKFASPEKYPLLTLVLSKLFIPLNRKMWNSLARKFGVNGKLDARPYEI